ncbi:hypothetical protein V8C42DRAFT_327507 [Trichoderma barbatum]
MIKFQYQIASYKPFRRNNDFTDIVNIIKECMTEEKQAYQYDAVACRRTLASLYEQDGSLREMCNIPSHITECFLDKEKLNQSQGISTIYGLAGSGKSVLASQISSANDFNTSNSIMLSYYFSISDYRRRSYLQLLVSFILQILYQGDASFSSAYVQTLHSLMPRAPEEITSSDLYRLLSGMLSSLSEFNVVCVIDALDECNEDSRFQLVGDFRRLVLDSPTRYKVFITCRPTDGVVRLLGPFDESNSINLDKDFDEKKTILLNQELDGDEFADLRDKLAKASATPLVISLLSTLRRTMDINKISDCTHYDAIYEHMLEQINAPSAWLEELLLCLAFAKRPLTVNELAGAMWMPPSSSNILSNGQLTLQKLLIAAPTQLRKDLELACGPLLRVVNGVVSLVHGTLRDFVRRRSGNLLQREAPQDGQANTQLYMLRKCLNMLSIPELWKMDDLISKRRPFDALCDPPIVSEPHIFALYAGSCLAVHMREDTEYVDNAASVMRNVTYPFLSDQNARDWWIRTFITSPTAEPASIGAKPIESSHFQLSASIGAWPMTELLLPKVGDSKDEIELALWDALRHGHAGTTELLLSKASIYNEDVWLRAMEKCCQYGRAELVSLVHAHWSKYGEVQPSADDIYRCLYDVANNGPWHVIPRLHEAFQGLIDAMEREYLTRLITVAVRKGWDGVVHELLLIDSCIHQPDANMSGHDSNIGDLEKSKEHEEKDQVANDDAHMGDNAPDYWLSYQLVEGSKFGSAAVIRLLAPYADLRYATGWLDFTALHYAALEDRTEALEQLLNQGVDIEGEDAQGATPLLLACLRGHVGTVQMLLNRGANPDHVAVESSRYRALHIAASSGNGTHVQILREARASENARLDAPRDTHLLRRAVLDPQRNSRYLEVARTLLEFGADVNAKNDHGKTPLHIAFEIENQGDKMVQLLLDFGANLDMLHENGNSGSNFQERVSLYWRSIRNDKPCIVDLLVKKYPHLINEVSDQGFNGLETCMRKDRPPYAEGRLPALFVELGLNPFQRRQHDQPSCFELSIIITHEKQARHFLEACAKVTPDDTTLLGINLKALRIATEINEPELWAKLAPCMDRIENETDEDDWNIHHFLYQAEPRRKYAEYQKAALRKTKAPTALVWPQTWQQWSKERKPRIEADGLGVFFEKSWSVVDEGAVTIRADFPFPPREIGMPYSYFELTIIDSTQKFTLEFVIGLTGEFTNQANALPGWHIWSVGYHSDDGGIYDHSEDTSNAIKVKPYGAGQTVGCGIDYESNEYFFTCDGEIVFRKSSTLIFRKLYPCIGHRGQPGQVRVNFGMANFKWQKASST